MISELDLTQEQKIYIENLEKVKKTTTDEFALKLIDSFFEDLNGTRFMLLNFKQCMEDYIFSKDSYTLDEIFPKKLYFILDIFMGRNGREDFLEVVRNIRKFPFRYGLRDENYKLYSNEIAIIFRAFTEKEYKNLSLIDILKKNNYSSLIMACLALEIDRGNQEVISILEEMILGNNTSFVLSGFVIAEIFKSNNKYLVELLGKTLLEADLQEGLREDICIRINDGTIENFKYMYEIIYENNLIKYSSVSYSLEKIFKFSKINKKTTEIVYKLFKGEQLAEELIKSDDIEEIYFSLWYIALFDVKSSVDKVLEILGNKSQNKISAVKSFLILVEDNLRSEISFKIVSESFDDEEIIESIDIFVYFFRFLKKDLRSKIIRDIICKIILKNSNNYQVVSCLCKYVFHLPQDGEDNQDILEKYLGSMEIAKNIF